MFIIKVHVRFLIFKDRNSLLSEYSSSGSKNGAVLS